MGVKVNLQPAPILCACGCGKLITKKGNKYINYHNTKANHNPNFKHGKTNNNKCLKCGKKISLIAKHCNICAGETRGRKGKIRTKEHREKISKTRIENGLSKGKNNPNYKNGLPKCIDCGKQLSGYKYTRCQICNYKFIKKRGLRKGKNNPAFKDGNSSLAIVIRNLSEYKQWIKAIFKRDNFTCQECGDIGNKLNAHHKIPFAKLLQEFLKEYDQFSPIEDKETLVRLAIKYKPFWEVGNGQTLCEDCHKLFHKTIKKGILK